MKPLKFNDTSNYEYLEALGVEGVFTSLRIARDTLPEGFYKYSFRDGEEELIGSICNEVLVNHAGDFITKEPLDLGPTGSKVLIGDDWSFLRKTFDFEEFFGQKLSIDCQIANAEAKRSAQMGEGRDNPGLSKSTALTQDDPDR